MANDNQLTNEEKQALLTEYQVCQEDNSANFQGFWTLAAIFIGLSSAFLAGLIYAVIANETLIGTLLTDGDTKKPLVIGVIALIVGIANVVILWEIKGWHRRIMFNQGVINGRMREIELQLGKMQRGWRIYAIDTWYDIIKSDKRKKCDDQKWDCLKKELEKDLDEKYRPQLDKLKDEILELLKQYFTERGKVKERRSKYELPSSRKHFPRILRTLMVLWGLVIVVGIIAIVWSVINM